jgi:hypothetical protein
VIRRNRSFYVRNELSDSEALLQAVRLKLGLCAIAKRDLGIVVWDVGVRSLYFCTNLKNVSLSIPIS